MESDPVPSGQFTKLGIDRNEYSILAIRAPRLF